MNKKRALRLAKKRRAAAVVRTKIRVMEFQRAQIGPYPQFITKPGYIVRIDGWG